MKLSATETEYRRAWWGGTREKHYVLAVLWIMAEPPQKPKLEYREKVDEKLPFKERKVLDAFNDSRRMELARPEIETINTLDKEIPAPEDEQKTPLEKTASFFKKHEGFFNSLGVKSAYVMWGYSALILDLLITVILLTLAQEKYSSGTWLENDIWLIILIIGTASGFIASLTSYFGQVIAKVVSSILFFSSTSLVGFFTAYQFYRSDVKSFKLIDNPQDLILPQFYLVGIIASTSAFFLLYLIFS